MNEIDYKTYKSWGLSDKQIHQIQLQEICNERRKLEIKQRNSMRIFLKGCRKVESEAGRESAVRVAQRMIDSGMSTTDFKMEDY